MNQNLERVIPQEARERLLLAVFSPVAKKASISDLAAEAGLSILDTVQLMNEPAFIAQVRQVTFAQASTALHGAGVADLVSIATSGKDRERLTAWRVIAQITGDLKQKHQHEVRVTFEDLRKRQGDGDLAGLFDIRSTVIEGQIEE